MSTKFRASHTRYTPGYHHNNISVLIIDKLNRSQKVWWRDCVVGSAGYILTDEGYITRKHNTKILLGLQVSFYR